MKGVTLDTSGLDALMRRMTELSGTGVVFGSVGEDGGSTGPHPGASGLSVAGVLQIHEFGLGVPERSIIRAVTNGQRDELATSLRVGAIAAVKGGAKAGRVAEILGKDAQALLLARHDALGSVTDEDGVTRPALDETGAVRASLRWASEAM
jgi:hypothetical protein